MMCTSIRSQCFSLSLLVLTACGGSKNPTPPPDVTSRIAVSAIAPTVSVAQGATVTASEISIARTSFTADVTLSAEGLPAGVTASFAPTVVSGGATASTMTLVATPTATLGAATVTLRARGTGVADATSQMTVTVTSAGPPPSASLTVTPPSR
jgi:hypothetical protein